MSSRVLGWVLAVFLVSACANKGGSGTGDGGKANADGGGGVNPAVPTAPRNLKATAADGSIHVSWDAPEKAGSSAITGYTATTNPSSRSATTDGALEVTIGKLVGAQRFTVSVTAKNAAGTGPAGTVEVALPCTVPGFGTLPSLYVPEGPAAVEAADMNGDGLIDLVVTRTDNVTAVYPGKGDGTYAQPLLTVGGGVAISVEDFDRDGKRDLLLLKDDATLALLRGRGDGSFLARELYSTSDLSSGLAVGDLNGDGALDVLVSMGGGFNVFLNKGDGTFTRTTLTTSSSQSMQLVDLDGDGKLDIVLTFGGTLLLSFPGNGDGTFGALKSVSLGATARGLAIADFDGDHTLDALVTTDASKSLFLKGSGGATFAAPREVPELAGIDARGVLTGDVDHDGKTDAVVFAYSTFRTGRVLLSKGDGTFTVHDKAPRATGFRDVLRDVDGDGQIDLVFRTPDSVQAVLGKGDGTFEQQLFGETPVGTAVLAAGDFNGDHKPDLITAGTGGARLLLGVGDGTFTAQAALPLSTAPNPHVTAIATGDFDHDGKLDFALTVVTSSASTLNVFFGQGDGTFAIRRDFNAGGTNSVSIAVGELGTDASHRPELLVSNRTTEAVALFQNDAEFTFFWADSYQMGASVQPYGVVMTDLNGDGFNDVAVARRTSSAGGFSYFLSGSTGKVSTTRIDFAVGGDHDQMAAADFNGDGKMDLVQVGGGSASQFTDVFLNAGTSPYFSERERSPASGQILGLVVGDFDLDGKVDVATGSLDQGLTVLLGNGDGTMKNPVRFGSTPMLNLVTADFNGDGRPDFASAADAELDVFVGRCRR